jgi:hypothetical protein
MSVEVATASLPAGSCSACAGSKNAPIACTLAFGELGPFALCEECGRDVANAVGFMCVRDGGWSKLEPRKRKVPR